MKTHSQNSGFTYPLQNRFAAINFSFGFFGGGIDLARQL